MRALASAPGRQGHPDDPPVGPGHQELAVWRIDLGIGDVDQAIALRAGEQPLHGAIEISVRWRLAQHLLELLFGQRIHANSPLSFCRPSWTLRRAAASELSRARAIAE